MSSTQPTNKHSSVSRFDERQWVMQIRQTLDEELEEDTEIEVSIFSVPKSLMATNPECYTPQQVPIGPYHYFHPEMYEMERYKLAAAKRVQQTYLDNIRFEDVVHQLRAYEPRVRASYQKYLTINGETLAWMMAVDASFILEFLQVYSMHQEGKKLQRISSRMSHLVDATGKKSTHNAILRDFFMVENQIPLFILRKMMEVKHNSLEIGDGKLYVMLMGLFKVLCPFKIMQELPEKEAMECAHMLAILYRVLVKLDPKEVEAKLLAQIESHNNVEVEEHKEGSDEKTHWGSQYVGKFLEVMWKIIKKILSGPYNILKKIFLSKAVVFITKLPWQIISSIPGIKFITGPIETLFSMNKDDDGGGGDADDDDEDKPPRVEEIQIPSVTDLANAYVKFEAVEGGISSIAFDPETVTLYLPCISLDENSEVIMRNLVAYEACHATGPVIFSRYTELMNGIIDTEEDVQILKESGIIKNRLKCDEDVMKLWNGMHKSSRLTKSPNLDRVIEDVNKYYKGRWKVKLKHIMKAYVFGSWQILTLLACIVLLLLMTLQSFCSVYSCSRFFPVRVMEVVPPLEE